jgi:hypothetical protein
MLMVGYGVVYECLSGETGELHGRRSVPAEAAATAASKATTTAVAGSLPFRGPANANSQEDRWCVISRWPLPQPPPEIEPRPVL